MNRFTPPDQALRQRFMQNSAPVPPSRQYKWLVLHSYLVWSGIKVFVETGTFQAETTADLAPFCKAVYSIELSPDLAAAAKQKFANFSHVRIIEGDSALVLPGILREIDEPALFWLDAHYCAIQSADPATSAVPILQELKAIFDRGVEEDIVLIDDVRLFVGEYGYPRFDELCDFVRRHRPGWVIDVAIDSARMHAPRDAAGNVVRGGAGAGG